MSTRVRWLLGLFLSTQIALAIPPDQKKLPIGLAPGEEIPLTTRAPQTSPPPAGLIRSLAEWEEADAVMTLWANPSLMKALAAHGNIRLFADSRHDGDWWKNFFATNHIDMKGVDTFYVATDSIWIRDYGPWFILDGQRNFGMIDTQYNRPRPHDDEIPIFLSKALNIPYYQPGLVHTGGNYYNDGMNNAFSSTLVYRENKNLPAADVTDRMKNYLGIGRYTTSPLGVGATIEHLDTFGKLVSPDTWVFSDFPDGSRFKKDADNMVALLKTLKSAYGTPYKIYRLKMVTRPGSSGEDYRAYLNAFISNHALYYAAYGDAQDKVAADVFQKALPGYDIVGVSASDTEWGDSVHCRNRNLLKRDTIFIFPELKQAAVAGAPIQIRAELVPSPGAKITDAVLHWSKNGEAQTSVDLKLINGNFFEATLPAQDANTAISFYVEAKDSRGKVKTHPLGSPQMQVDVRVGA